MTQSSEYADDYSGYANEVLYRMCREQPFHTNTEVVESKIFLIGRAYAAAIERKARPSFNSTEAAEEIIKVGKKLDKQIQRLNEIGRPEIDNVHDLLSTHGWLTKTFEDLTCVRKRSLASKYLHFHAPLSVFIFDSIVLRNVSRHTERVRVAKAEGSKSYDEPYENFVRRALILRGEKEHELGTKISPRRFDALVYIKDEDTPDDYIARVDQTQKHCYWTQPS